MIGRQELSPFQAGSADISIFSGVGGVPAKLTVPLIVAVVAGSIGDRFAEGFAESFVATGALEQEMDSRANTTSIGKNSLLTRVIPGREVSSKYSIQSAQTMTESACATRSME